MGILMACGLIASVPLLAPLVGEYVAIMIPLAIIIFVIIVFGSVLPVIFNRITFCFLTISCIDSSILLEHAVEYGLVFLIGGGIMVAGCWGILVLCRRFLKKDAPETKKEMPLRQAGLAGQEE